MMKFLLILFFVLPLSLAAPGEGSSKSKDPLETAIERHGKRVSLVLKMTETGESIKDALRPLSFLNSGNAGFVFKGVTSEGIAVAIKFYNKDEPVEAKREYEMYSYLSAINNTEVENYGIPTVHYYGRWKGLIVMACTELEKTLFSHMKSKTDLYTIYDVLLLIRQFIKQSKYIHSRGIRHDDIKLENIMTRGCESFLIDFDKASKMAEENYGATDSFASLKYHQNVDRVATDDWESFLYTICYFGGIKFDWFKRDLMERIKVEELDAFRGKLKSNRSKIFETIDQSKLKILPQVIRAFAEEALSDKPIPNYDRLYDYVTDALAQHFPRQTCFSWTVKHITDGSSRNEVKESTKRANTNINDLVIPTDFKLYTTFIYPNVDEEIFQDKESK